MRHNWTDQGKPVPYPERECCDCGELFVPMTARAIRCAACRVVGRLRMIRVRRSTYCDKEGWTVSGYPTSERTGWPISVFFEHESAARRFATLVRAGETPEHIDWSP